MNLWLIILPLVTMGTGVIVGWYTYKLKVTTSFFEIKTKLDSAENNNLTILKKLDDLSEDFESINKELNECKTDKAVCTAQLDSSEEKVSNLNTTKDRLEAEIIGFRVKLNDCQQEVTKYQTIFSSNEEKLIELENIEQTLRADMKLLMDQSKNFEIERATLKETVKLKEENLNKQKEFIKDAEKKLHDAFSNLSANALRANNQSFVDLAKESFEKQIIQASGVFEKKEKAIGELVKPLSESLKNMDTKIGDLEKERLVANRDIFNNLSHLHKTTEDLKTGTSNLLGALKTSHHRGRYGEIALKRLVEHAGMVEHCDFKEQVTIDGEDGKLRPDMIIKLPGNKLIVVDSKAPLSSYLSIFETEDNNQQKDFLEKHVAAVKKHLRGLGEKAYWDQFKKSGSTTPDFVIMYMHIESSYGAALQAWPEMIEDAMKNRIIIATPTVLLSILMSVGYSWNQINTMEKIEDIRDAAVELYNRSSILFDHFNKMGGSLRLSVDHYNKAVGSFERSFLPKANEINKLSQAYLKDKKEIEVALIETDVRPMIATQAQLINDQEIKDNLLLNE